MIFLDARQGLRNEILEYYKANGISEVSQNAMHYLLNQYDKWKKDGVSLFVVDYPAAFENRYPSRLRDADNPERALEFCYDKDAKEHGLPNFGNVLVEFFNIEDDTEFEGYMIRNIFESRGIDVPSEIPNSWYGENFNFVPHNSGVCMKIIFDNDNNSYLPTWILDEDGDDYHAKGSSPRKQATSPGTGWVQGVSAGEDCDDNTPGISKPIRWYFDEDEDGFHTETRLACESPGEGWTKYSSGIDECPTESGEVNLSGCVVFHWRIDNDKDYYFVPGSLKIQNEKPVDGNHWIYETSGEDCDDDNPDIKSDCAESIPWYYDNDGDGYHSWSKKYISTPKGDKYSKTTKGKDCDDNRHDPNNDCSSSCKKRIGYLYDANFTGKTVIVGDNVTIKRDNFRNDDWGIISETNCKTGKVPIGSTVKVTSTTAITRPGTSLKYFKVEYDECSTENKNKLDCSDKDCSSTKEDLKKAFPNATDATLEKLHDLLEEHGKKFGIDTNEGLQHFLAQAGHETVGFKNIGSVEDLTYSASRLVAVWPSRFSQTDSTKLDPDDYANDEEKLGNYVYGGRMGNDNIASGDGYKYRGRGLFQLTGKDNYSDFTNFYQDNIDATKDFVTNPDLLSSDEDIAVLSAMWFYRENVLNKIVVDNNTSVDRVSKKINKYEESKIRKKRKEIFDDKVLPNVDCD